MAFRYDHPADAQQQLDHTVIMSEKGGVYLRCQHNWEYEVQYLRSGDIEIKDIREIGLTFEPIELGYVNHYGGLSYIVRHPYRMWKQGITYDNIKAVRGHIHEGLLTHSSFNDTFLGTYPTPQEAYKRAMDTGEAVAFHRDFALTFDEYPRMELEYKGKVIGSMNKDRDFEVSDKFHYVKELLEEVLHAEN